MGKIEFEVRSDGINETYEGTVGITSIIRNVEDYEEFDAVVHGTTNDQDLVFLGLSAIAGVVEHLKEKYPDKKQEEILGLIAESFVTFMEETNYGLILEKIMDYYQENEYDTEDFDENENQEAELTQPFSSQDSQFNIFDFLGGINEPDEDEEEKIALAKEFTFSDRDEKTPDREVQVEVGFLGEKQHLKGTLALYNIKKQDLTGAEILEADVRGYGQVDDLIKLGCESYNFALNHAIEKWHEAEPDRNKMEIQMSVYQTAMQYLMGAQFGNLGIDDLFGQIFSVDNQDDDEES